MVDTLLRAFLSCNDRGRPNASYRLLPIHAPLNTVGVWEFQRVSLISSAPGEGY